VTVRDNKNIIRNIIVRELLSIEAVRLDHVHTDEILADPLTKGLAREKVHNTSMKMGLLPMESLMMVTNLNDWRSKEIGSMGNNKL